MKITIGFVRDKFREFNLKLFAGRLPEPVFKISESKTYVGLCRSRLRVRPDGYREHYDFELSFSTRLDLTQAEAEDTIIHEMIHYFIQYNGLPDSSAHGHIFRAMMQSINASHSRHITISHRSDGQEPLSDGSLKASWHIIAVVRFRDGKAGIKVLPRVAQRVIGYYNQVRSVREVHTVELLLSNNGFFDRYPVSVALRVHYLDPDILKQQLSGAQIIKVDGPRLIPTKERYP